MTKEIYIGIGIESLGNGIGAGLQMTGVVNPVIGWIIIGFSIPIGLIFIIYGIRIRSRMSKEKEFHLEFNDNSITTNDGRILLGVNYLPSGRVTIQNLQLEYNDRRLRPSDWQPIQIEHSHTKNYTFDLDELQKMADKAAQEAVFIVKVNGKEIRSFPFNVYELL